MRLGRVFRLAVSLALGATTSALAQPPSPEAPDAGLEAQIRLARERLQQQRPNLAPEQPDRSAAEPGRANHLERLLTRALEQMDFTGALQLLEEFPGNLNDLRVNGQPPIFPALAHDQPALLEALLKRGADPNQPDLIGRLPLHLAMERWRWDLALMLVRGGAAANARDRFGRTPLGTLAHFWGAGGARRPDPQDLLLILLEHGANPFLPASTNPFSSSPVELMLERGEREAADLMLTNPPVELRHTPDGDTALHLAAIWARTNALDFLLDAGWDVNQTNRDGLTPLQALVGARTPRPLQRFIVMGVGSYPVPMFSPPGFGSMIGMRPTVAPPGQPSTLTLAAPPLAERLLARGAALDIFSAAALSRWIELDAMLRNDPKLANARDGLGRTPLHYAVFAGRIAATRRLLAAGADPSATTVKALRLGGNTLLPEGTTPLHVAVRVNSDLLVRMLLGVGANPAAADSAGDTPLHIAATQYDTNCLALLIRAGAPLNRTNRDGFTPLQMAVSCGSPDNVALLLRAGDKPDPGPGGKSLFHLAVERNRLDVFPVLARHGLPLDAPDAAGRTPFFLAVQSRWMDTVAWLYGRGANIQAADTNGDTALHLLLAQGHDLAFKQIGPSFWDRWKQQRLARPGLVASTLQKLIQFRLLAPPRGMVSTNISLTAWLLERGANPNATNRAGKTPLHLTNFREVWFSPGGNPITNQIAHLLRAGARVDAPDAKGETPLHHAAQYAPPEILTLLIEATDRPRAPATRLRALNARDAAGRTPLHALVAEPSQYHLTNAAVLLSHGADPNARDAEGNTPLHKLLADTRPHVRRRDLVKLLLDWRADPNATNHLGQTPLYAWTDALLRGLPFAGDLELLRTLLDAGADPRLCGTNGQSLLHLLVERGGNRGNIRGILEELRSRDADLIHLTNALGDTLLHTALRANNSLLVRWLLELGADPARRNAAGESALWLAAQHANPIYGFSVRPTGVTESFWNTLLRRDYRQFEIWLRAEPRLAQLPYRNGQTPLTFAVTQRLTNFVNLLLELGAPWDPVSAMHLGRTNELRALLQNSNCIPHALLVEAIRLKRFDAIRDLAEARGELHAPSPCDRSLLREALERGQTNGLADWLRQHGVALTPYDAAELGDTNALCRWLAAHPAALNRPCPHGHTLLGAAAQAGQTESVRALLALGADPNAQRERGYTPLHLATMRNQLPTAELLLEAGAVVDARDAYSLTPLHHAARLGHAALAALLLKHGADVNAPTTNAPDPIVTMPTGATPLHWAAHAGRLDAVRLLLDHGANPSSTNALGQTPLDLVRTNLTAPSYRFAWGTFREPPPGDPVRAQIARMLAR